MLCIVHLFFTVLGVIFFCLMLAGAYFYITDPYNITPLIFGVMNAPSEVGEEGAVTDEAPREAGNHPLLTDTQERTLETLGIDSSDVPSEFTPQQEACLSEMFGSARVEEVKNGAIPTAAEFFQARECL